MSFTARTREEIRDKILAYWTAEYDLRGETLLTAPGSDAYIMASQIALIQEAIDVQAEQVARDILPDQASTSGLDRFGAVYGIPREGGSYAQATVTVTGAAPATTYAIPAGTQMAYSDGTLYDVTSTSVTTNGASLGTISVIAVVIGSGSTRNVGDVLTFQTAPAGLNPTGPVATTTPGTDAADDDTYRAALLLYLSERPGSGNRSDWRGWVMSYRGTTVADAYVYPLLRPPAVYPGDGTASTLGCVTVVPLGPPQGDSLVEKRIVPYDDSASRLPGRELPRIEDFINGTRTASGVTTSSGTQLRPATMGPARSAWSIETPRVEYHNVIAQIVVTAANAFTFAVAPTIDITSTTTTVVVAGDYSASGTNLSGLKALVPVGVSGIRGGYEVTTLGTGTYDFGTGLTTFPVATLLDVPIAVANLCGYTPAWEALRTEVFAYFDALTPSDTTPPSRWPAEDAVTARSTLYRSRLAAVMVSVPGVLSANIGTPGGDVVPATPKTIIALDAFLVRP